MKPLTRSGIALLFSLIAFGCGGTTEIPPVTEPGENSTEAENKARMEQSMKMGGRTAPE
jgi:hypothetical protein